MVAHNVLRLSGTLPGGEAWSVSPKFMGNFGEPVTTYEALDRWARAAAQGAGPQFFPSNLRNMLSSAVALTTLRAEHRDAAGDLVDAAEFVLPNPIPGNSTPRMPYQCAWVSSLRTGRPGGRYRGRLYWPCYGLSVEPGTLRIPTNVVEAATADVATLLTALAGAAAPDAALVPAVVSMKGGHASRVTQVVGGDIVDTQRRRRDALAEGYSIAQLTPPAEPEDGENP